MFGDKDLRDVLKIPKLSFEEQGNRVMSTREQENRVTLSAEQVCRVTSSAGLRGSVTSEVRQGQWGVAQDSRDRCPLHK